MGNVVGALLLITGAASTVSVAIAAARKVAMVALLAAVPDALVASTVILAGAATVGAVVSAMVTVCVALPRLFDGSVTLHVTVVVPTGNGPGLSGNANRDAPELSLTLAEPKIDGVNVAVASIF